ncbi:MAG: arabinan endo-1,5-alpha-L-arabinosidase [Bacteroidota bacterium]|nr:arabinan endo-1,5-alpha-L-arabinosidase [Bacteroidota bacterium]
MCRAIIHNSPFLICFICLNIVSVRAQVSANPIVHDPVLIKQDSVYHLFCTGMGIAHFSSTDMKHWKHEPPVFPQIPDWTAMKVKGFKGHFWAPDISFYKGKYYLFYAVSEFGKNTSCIGLAENKTLNTSSPNYKWIDKGMVVQSVPGRDMWNAIDPNLIVDEDGTPWLDFGSFWEGIKLVRLKSDLSAIDEHQQWFTLASRERKFGTADSLAGDAAIEAPFIFKHGDYYYLFVSFDYCCRGINSTYKVMVGRSKEMMGPYLDKKEVPMTKGGGSLVVEGNKDWYGVGHNAVYHVDGKDIIIYHGYSAADNGKPHLIVHDLLWDQDGWPVVQ